MILDLHGFGEQLLAGTWMTLKLSLAAVCVGLLLGLLGAIAKTSKYAALRFLGGTYTTIVRGVPETLWVLMIYFGTVSGLNALGDLFGTPDLALSPFAAGTLALGLCFGAYATEVFRGAKCSISAAEGQMPCLTVRKGRRTLRVPAYGSVAYLDGKPLKLRSAVVYIDRNDTFYLPRELGEKF